MGGFSHFSCNVFVFLGVIFLQATNRQTLYMTNFTILIAGKMIEKGEEGCGILLGKRLQVWICKCIIEYT